MTHIWSSVYLPEQVYIDFFIETIKSLEKSVECPEMYIFYISGEFSSIGKEMIEKSSLTALVLTTNSQVSQFQGYKHIMEECEIRKMVPKYVLFMDGDDIVSLSRFKIMTDSMYQCSKKSSSIKAVICPIFWWRPELIEDDYIFSIKTTTCNMDNRIEKAKSENHIQELFKIDNNVCCFQVYSQFKCQEETTNMIVEYETLKCFLQKDKNLHSRTCDISFYQYLIDHRSIVLCTIPNDEIIYYYRKWK